MQTTELDPALSDTLDRARQPGLTLVIGNKNYSSWSMRPWVAAVAFGIPFNEVRILLDQPETSAIIARFSHAGRVPVLVAGEISVWDSLAICEYLAEQFPDLHMWPQDVAARAMARSITAEMHSGFAGLRSAMSMNIQASLTRPRPHQRSPGRHRPHLRNLGRLPVAFRPPRILVRRFFHRRRVFRAGRDALQNLRRVAGAGPASLLRPHAGPSGRGALGARSDGRDGKRRRSTKTIRRPDEDVCRRRRRARCAARLAHQRPRLRGGRRHARGHAGGRLQAGRQGFSRVPASGDARGVCAGAHRAQDGARLPWLRLPRRARRHARRRPGAARFDHQRDCAG